MFWGNLFARWPYTDLENLNLDWIIGTVKELSEKYPQLLSDIAKKLNTPNTPGELGDFLINLGNGNTKWENMSERFIPVIVEAVNDWLTDHPEATTTVQDGTITRAKLSTDVLALLDAYKIKKTLQSFTNYSQDATAYGTKIFEIGTDNATVKVFDTLADDYVATITLSGGIRPHGNAISFGSKLYETDDYPLLYVTGYNGYDENDDPLPKGTCFVYHIANDYTSTLLQAIKINFITDTLWVGTRDDDDAVKYGNFIIDPDNNKLYVYTTLRDNICSKTRLFIFNTPSIVTANVTLNISDILEYIDLPFYPYIQGGEYYNNKLYISYGMTRANSRLAVIDLGTKTQIGNVYLGDIMTEPEAVIILNNELYVAQYGFFKLGPIPYESNIGNLSKLITDRNDNLINAINTLVPVTTDISNGLTNTEDFQYGVFHKRQGIVNISYQGKSATQTAAQVLFTLPVGSRPKGLIFTTGTLANIPIVLRIDTQGNCTIWVASETALSATNRIYFSTSFMCE